MHGHQRRSQRDTASSVERTLSPARRIVFTYGWERANVEVPPGSTTVEITLRSHGTGTELHLVHRGLAGPMADAHAGGWDN
ncbi:MAG TPA: SRPBCC domain-containing protein [Jiangellaceae bacterium]|nr:SRPBCC domain-containing protein [Jiangellaceae bacterium]